MARRPSHQGAVSRFTFTRIYAARQYARRRAEHRAHEAFQEYTTLRSKALEYETEQFKIEFVLTILKKRLFS